MTFVLKGMNKSRVYISEGARDVCIKRNEQVASISEGARDVCIKRNEQVASISEGTYGFAIKGMRKSPVYQREHDAFLTKELRFREYNGDWISFIYKHVGNCVYISRQIILY